MITNTILLICVGIFICIHMLEKSSEKGVLAIKYGALYPPRVEIKKEYWRLLSANFVHVDFMHIFMNMYGIYYLGGNLESFLGRLPYLYIVIMSCLFTTGITYYLSTKNVSLENKITLGASGIFYGYLGVIIALGVIFQGPYLRLLNSYMYIIMINIAFTFMNRNISKTGHLGGLIGGFIATVVLIGTGICTF